jgi:hypothetical protein
MVRYTYNAYLVMSYFILNGGQRISAFKTTGLSLLWIHLVCCKRSVQETYAGISPLYILLLEVEMTTCPTHINLHREERF